MRAYLKLICKSAAVMLPLIILIFWFSVFPNSFIDEEAPYYIWNREVSRQGQDKYYDTVILGDSVANAAYMPELLSDSTINLSLSGSTPLENYYTLQEWLEKHDPPKTCYLSFTDDHFLFFSTFWTRVMYSHRYSLEDNIAMLRATVDTGKTGVWNMGTIWDFIAYEAWLPNKYITAFMNAGFTQRQQVNAGNTALIELHRGRYVGRSVYQYAPAEVQTVDIFRTVPPFESYYKMLIGLCIENGIQVRIIRLPMPENCVFTDEYRETFYSYYNALQAEHPGVTVDWFPHYGNECFIDKHHMNDYGALRFATELKALYPGDFGVEPPSAEQIAGINDYISLETDLDHIFDWVAGRGYTALLYDTLGVVPTLYGESIDTAFSDVPLAVMSLGVGQAPEGENIYAVVENGQPADAAVLRAEDGTLMVQTAGGGPAAWAVVPGAALSVFVIDSFGRTVCAKSFSCTEGTQITLLG